MSGSWIPMATELECDAAAKKRFVGFCGKFRRKNPASSRLGGEAWREFVPFLDYDVEICHVICGTNAVESLNARYWGGPGPGQIPTVPAVLKCLY